MHKLLDIPQQSNHFLQRIPKIHQKLSKSVDQHGKRKTDHHNSCQSQLASKKYRLFNSKRNITEKISTRYSPFNQKTQYIIKNKSKNIGVISELFKSLKRDKSYESARSDSQKKSISDLKAELKNLTSNKNQMIPSSLIRKRNKSKNSNLSSTSTPKIVEVTQKQIKDYGQFIKSKNSNYFTQVNFNFIRQNDRQSSLNNIDLLEYHLIESVTLCLIDALKNYKEINPKLIKQYCIIYLQNQNRKKIEVFLNFHIFKAFAQKVRSFFVYQRIFYYAAYKTAQRQLIAEQRISRIYLQAFQVIVISIQSVLDVIKDFMNKKASNIMETFRSLKMVKQIQSLTDKIQKSFQQFQKYLQTLDSSIEQVSIFKLQIHEIIGNLRPFLGQSNFYHKVQQFEARSTTILNWKMLRLPPIPYLPNKNQNEPKYTLVLGLNQVLINFNPANKILKYRAFMDTFLQKIMDKFQIVIFSEFDKQLTDRIIKEIEKNHQFFHYRLYRIHQMFKKGNIIKDIKSLGRRLELLIYIDNQSDSGEQCFQNWIQIAPFKPSTTKLVHTKQQNALLTVLNDLYIILQKNPDDVRQMLKKKNQRLDKIPEVSSLEERSLSITNTNQGQLDRY